MMFLVRFMINFCVSFVILSIPIDGKTIFSHLYKLTASVASNSTKTLKDRSKSLFFKREKFRRNTNQEEKLAEFVPGKVSASKEGNVDSEPYTDEEREVMRKVFEDHLQ